MAAGQAPAGWHPDPRGRHELRYWDGTQWTDHVADAGAVSTDPVVAVMPIAAPTEPSRADLPAVARAHEATAGGADAVPQPRPQSLWAREPEPDPQPEPEPDAAHAGDAARPDAAAPDPPAAGPTDAPRAAPPPDAAPGERSPALAALLSIVAPGSGHLYLGRAGAIPAFLLAATVLAIVLAYLDFALFVVGLALWLSAAAYAVTDLRGGLDGLRAGRMPVELAGWTLAGAGLALLVSLVLPFYHVSVDVQGFGGASGSASGFEAFGLLDLLLVVLAAAAALTGLAAVGAGPVSADRLPSWLAPAVMGGALAGLVLLAYRMLDHPGDFSGGGLAGVDVSVGRGPGLLLAAAACIAIAATARSVAGARGGLGVARPG